MGEDLGEFIRDLGAMTRLAQEARPRSARGREALDTLSTRLGTDPGQVVVEDVAAHRFADAHIILADLAGDEAGWSASGWPPAARPGARTITSVALPVTRPQGVVD